MNRMLLGTFLLVTIGLHASIFHDIGSTIKDGFHKAKDIGEDATHTLKSNAEDIAKQVKDVAQSQAGKVKDIAGSVVQQMHEAQKKTEDIVADVSSKIESCGKAMTLGSTLPPEIITSEVARAILQVVKNVAGDIKIAENVIVKIGDIGYSISQKVLTTLQQDTIHPSTIYAHIDLHHPTKTEFMFEGKVFGQSIKVQIDPFNPKASAESIIHAGLKAVADAKGGVTRIVGKAAAAA